MINSFERHLMNRRETCAFFGGHGDPLTAAQLYAGIGSGKYPKPVKVDIGIFRWLRSECVLARNALAKEAAA